MSQGQTSACPSRGPGQHMGCWCPALSSCCVPLTPAGTGFTNGACSCLLLAVGQRSCHGGCHPWQCGVVGLSWMNKKPGLNRAALLPGKLLVVLLTSAQEFIFSLLREADPGQKLCSSSVPSAAISGLAASCVCVPRGQRLGRVCQGVLGVSWPLGNAVAVRHQFCARDTLQPCVTG